MSDPIKPSPQSEAALRFCLSDAPFGRKGSLLNITEGTFPTETGSSAHQLCLSKLHQSHPITRTTAAQADGRAGDGAKVYLRPFANEQTADFEAAFTPAILTAASPLGMADFAFDRAEVLRVRADAPLRVFAPLGEHEAAIDRLDGTFHVSFFDEAGELLFVPIRGRFVLHTRWCWTKAGTDDLLCDLLPDSEGVLEFAVHFALANTAALKAYRPFDDCAKETAEDYAAWLSHCPDVLPRHEGQKRLCLYTLWSCYAPVRKLAPHMLLQAGKSRPATSWHAAFAALCLGRGADAAVELLLSPFAVQDESGMLPLCVDDRHVSWLYATPPCQGAALVFLMDKLGGRFTAAHAERLYAPLRRLHGGWMAARDMDGDGAPLYRHALEAVWEMGDVWQHGVAAETPALLSQMALLEEALGRLAERLARPREAESWFALRDRSLSLLSGFWDGSAFSARLLGERQMAALSGMSRFSPALLGGRLPKEVMDALCLGISRELEGCEPPTAEDTALWLLMALGLCQAGRRDIALRLVEAALSRPVPADSALDASVWLSLAGLARELTEKEGAQ